MMIHFIRYHGESQLLEQAFKKVGLRLESSAEMDQGWLNKGKGLKRYISRLSAYCHSSLVWIVRGFSKKEL